MCVKASWELARPSWLTVLTIQWDVKLYCIVVWCSGELVWPDGRRYCGMFADGQFEGLGIYTQPSDDLGIEISEGMWKAGQLHGQARVRSVFLS